MSSAITFAWHFKAPITTKADDSFLFLLSEEDKS